MAEASANASEEQNKGIPNGYEDSESKQYVEEGKNKLSLRCKFCSSKMLEKHAGSFVVIEKDLPLIHIDNTNNGVVTMEKIKEFYHVENMYIFENIGFTHQVDNCKYLSCADCDAGPVGWYDINTKQSYVAISRVQQDN